MANTTYKVGVFVTLSAVVFGGVILFFGEIPIFHTERVDYVVYFKNAGGLSKGSDVRVAGVKVGKVKSIGFENGKVKVVVELNEKVPIYRNAVAEIRSLGLLGDKYVEIDPGDPSSGELPPDSVIRYTKKPADISNMVDALAKTAKSIEKLSQNLNELVAENRKQISDLLVNLNELSKSLNELVTDNRKSLRETLKSLERLTRSLERQLPKLVKNLNTLAVNLNKSTKEITPDLKRSLKNFSTLAEHLTEVSKVVEENRKRISKILKHIEKITADIERGKGTLGKLVRDKELYRKLKKSLSALSRASSVITRTQLHIEAWAQYEGTGDSKAGIHLMLQPDRKKYYLLGIVGDSAGRVTKKTYYENGVPKEVVEKEYKPEITLQYARIFPDRWFHKGSSFVFRFGLKESTGGVGLDYVFNDRLMFTSDIWDFGRQDRPNEDLKPNTEVGFKYMFYGPFFIKAGGYDLLNAKYRTIYVGGGMSFTDNDLKYLMGGINIPGF